MLEVVNKLLPIIGILSFVKAIIEWRRSQIWKESEFLSKEMKEFFSDEKIKTVLLLLDWNSRKINIGGKSVFINDDILIEALKTHSEKGQYTTEESYLREIFDNFFDRLSHLKIYSKNGLVSEDKIFNYLDYYFRILIYSGRKSDKFISAINNYLNYYQFNNTIELLTNFKNQTTWKSRLFRFLA